MKTVCFIVLLHNIVDLSKGQSFHYDNKLIGNYFWHSITIVCCLNRAHFRLSGVCHQCLLYQIIQLYENDEVIQYVLNMKILPLSVKENLDVLKQSIVS